MAALCGCDGGAATPNPTCRSLPTGRPPSAATGAVSATADSAAVAPGGSITLTVTITGPVHTVIDCASPLQVSIVDAAGLSVGGGLAPVGAAAQCGDVRLPAGRALTATENWRPDPTLPSGTYSASLTLGDQPPVTLELPVRTARGGCG